MAASRTPSHLQGRYKTPRARTCVCGIEFMAIRPKERYCSRACLVATQRVPQVDSMRRTRKRLRLEVMHLLGGKCLRCGIDDKRVLEIDHINGDGENNAANKPSQINPATKWRRMIAELRSGVVRIQLLCANCHKIKTVVNGERFQIEESLEIRSQPKFDKFESNIHKCRACGLDFEASYWTTAFCGDACRKMTHNKACVASLRRRRKRLRIEIIDRLGGSCAGCGVDDVAILEMDHIAGDGDNSQATNPKPMPRELQRKRILSEMDSGLFRIQILCANCHKLKTLEAGDNREIHDDLSYRLNKKKRLAVM